MENYSIAYNPFVTGQRFRLRLCVGCANRFQSILISAGYIFGCFLTSDEWRMDEIVVKIVGVKHSSRHIPHSKIHNLNCNVLLIQFLYRFKCKIFQWKNNIYMIYLASFIFSGFSFCVFSFPFHKYCFLTIRCGYPISSKNRFFTWN